MPVGVNDRSPAVRRRDKSLAKLKCRRQRCVTLMLQLRVGVELDFQKRVSSKRTTAPIPIKLTSTRVGVCEIDLEADAFCSTPLKSNNLRRPDVKHKKQKGK